MTISVGEIRSFRPLGNNRSQSIPVTTSNVSTALNDTPFGTRAVRCANVGTDVIYIDFSTGAGTASITTSMVILPNQVNIFTFARDLTHVNVIGVTGGVSTLNITYGEGKS